MSSEHEPAKPQTDQPGASTPTQPANSPAKPQTDKLDQPEAAKPAEQLDAEKKTGQPANSPAKPQTDKLDQSEMAQSAEQPVAEKETDQLDQSAVTDAHVAQAEAEQSAIALTCPVCGLVNRPGELACSRCGTILAAGGTTRKLDSADEPPKPASWPTGDVIVTGQAPIIFEIEGREMTVPVAEVITVGRMSDIPDDSRPDVDLSEYGAGEKGVSRKHVKIKRKNILVYVADLGSTNGTLLNGRRLIPNAERLLRNGDELQLGRLKIKVKF